MLQSTPMKTAESEPIAVATFAVAGLIILMQFEAAALARWGKQ